MWFSVSEHLRVTLYSFFIGLLLGVLYDVIRLTRITLGLAVYSNVSERLYRHRLPFIRESRAYIGCGSGKGKFAGALIFIGDIVYALVSAAVYSVFLFHAIRGQVRWYFIASSAVGFFAYYFTVSCFFLTVLEVVVFVLRAAVRYITELFLLPIRVAFGLAVRALKALRLRIAAPIMQNIKYRRGVRYTEKIRLGLGAEMRF